MASDEILNHIPTGVYLKIKATDPHPQFRAFVVGHEGESTGKVAVDGINFIKVVKRWYKTAIENLYEKINLGINLFNGHSFDNNQSNRSSVGEVVGKALEMVKDKLSVIMIGYIKPQFRQLPFDVASIEADLRLQENDGEYLANVDAVHGIALGNHTTETPGFSGATLLAQVQEFAENLPSFKGKGKEMTVTIDDVRAFINAEKLGPMDLFSLGALTDVPEVRDLVRDKEKDARKGEFEHRRRTDSAFDKAREEWEAKDKEKDSLITQLKPLAISNKRDDLFKTKSESRKLDEKEVKFIQRNLSKFNPEKIDDLEKELDTFMDTQIEEFNSLVKEGLIIGPPKKEGSGDNKDNEDSANKGSNQGQTENPFISV